jgi:hypothetical protein
MNSEIIALLESLDKYTQRVKDTKSKLKDLVESSEMYKNVYESSLSTVGENGFEVSEKDAAKHAYSVTLKNIRKINDKK